MADYKFWSKRMHAILQKDNINIEIKELHVFPMNLVLRHLVKKWHDNQREGYLFVLDKVE